MIHGTAARLLSALLDETLPAGREAALRRHVSDCARCERRLAEFELSDGLLRQMPASVVPLEWRPATYGRLAALARWSAGPGPALRSGWRGPVLGVAGLMAGAILAVTIWAWSPLMAGSSPVSLAFIPSDSLSLPVSWRPGL